MPRRLARAAWRATRWGLRKASRYPRLAAAGATGLVAVTAVAIWWRPVFVPPPGELQCLALNIYHEARGEAADGRIAVAMVVLNRVADRAFPDDVCAVVRQGGSVVRHRCQFSWYCDGRSDTPADAHAWADSRRLALRSMRGDFGDPSRGALWYHEQSISPPWAASFAARARIGRHVFYIRPARGESMASGVQARR